MSIQKINVGGVDVEIEDASARNLINTLDDRVTTLENSPGGGGSGGSEWVELTTNSAQEAEITQKFSEIRLLAKGTNANFSVTYSYDSTIFHNKPNNPPSYMICGNPVEYSNGCTFKYMVGNDGKQYVCADNCFTGGRLDSVKFRAWIKPVQS